jgi:uncharacterized pyridoxamine 5'-phosphate oxidase family protein
VTVGTTNAASEEAFLDEMMKIVREVQWSFLATADGNQPRVRVVHPVWDGFTCYVATGPDSPKARQIRANAKTEMFYWSKAFQHLTITGPGRFSSDEAERKRAYDLFSTAPEGYDPKMFWPNGPDASFALLRIDPDRIEITGMMEAMQGTKPRVWRP